MAGELSASDQFLLRAIEEHADEIADHQDKIADLRNQRDDLIRRAIDAGIKKTTISRAADISVEAIRLIEGFRYTRDTRRKPQRNPGPQRD